MDAVYRGFIPIVQALINSHAEMNMKNAVSYIYIVCIDVIYVIYVIYLIIYRMEILPC
jgi:hypothetical protein